MMQKKPVECTLYAGRCHLKDNAGQLHLYACQLHLKDNTVHLYGLRDQPCTGSDCSSLGNIHSGGGPPIIVSFVRTLTSLVVTGVASSLSIVPSITVFPPSTSIIKHIPQIAKAVCASCFSSHLRVIIQNPAEQANWSRLLALSARLLAAHPRGGKSYNLSHVIKGRVTPTLSSAVPQVVGTVTHPHSYSGNGPFTADLTGLRILIWQPQ